VKVDLARVQGLVRRHATASVLSALLLAFAGFDLLLNPSAESRINLIGLPFLVGGLAVFALLLRSAPSGAPAEPRRTLASRFLARVTLGGRAVRWFPAIAIAVIAADLAYNARVPGAISLGWEDTAVLLFAAGLFAYPFVPSRFGREGDFVLAFLTALILILVVPLLLARLYYNDFERSVDIYSWTLLAPQTAWVLNLLGVQASVGPFPGANAPALTFVSKSGTPLTVIITTACSGIYSFGIFASAFVAFVLTEYERFEPKVLGLLAIGFATSYVANVLRMVLIVLIGAYSSSPEASVQNLLIAHSNLGWIIFLGWISLFWGIVFRFYVRRPAPEPTVAPRKHGVLCGICADALTPALPGYRCECGKFYHVACAATVEECPRCHRPMKVSDAGEGSPASP